MRSRASAAGRGGNREARRPTRPGRPPCRRRRRSPDRRPAAPARRPRRCRPGWRETSMPRSGRCRRRVPRRADGRAGCRISAARTWSPARRGRTAPPAGRARCWPGTPQAASGHQQRPRPPCDADQAGFVEPVGQLPGGGRQQRVGGDEQRAGQCREAGAARAELEDGQHDHGVLDQVVVERAAGLGQAQRPQPARKQQGFMHDPEAVCIGAAIASYGPEVRITLEAAPAAG